MTPDAGAELARLRAEHGADVYAWLATIALEWQRSARTGAGRKTIRYSMVAFAPAGAGEDEMLARLIPGCRVPDRCCGPPVVVMSHFERLED